MLAQRFDWCVAFALLRNLTYDLVTRSELEPPKVSSDVTKTASDRYSVIVFSCADNVNSLSRPFIRDSKLGPSGWIRRRVGFAVALGDKNPLVPYRRQ